MSLLERMGLGVDVQEVAAFEDHAAGSERAFLQRVFTPRELEWCRSMPHPAQHLAARFAAKEAVIKALAPFAAASFEQIEIERDDDGRPSARLSLDGPGAFAVRLSLSHSDTQAMAAAIVERLDDGE